MGSEFETQLSPHATLENGCCDYNCSRCQSSLMPWQRSVKRRVDKMEEEEGEEGEESLGKNHVGAPLVDVLARVEIGNECYVLREAVSSKQEAIIDLQIELEEERNASSTAANEAMSMILRLQREKAEVEMEARQFKRFAEEKMAHDQEEILALEDAFFKRDQAMQALSYEVQAYKHRLMSYGIDPDSDMNEEVEEGATAELNDGEKNNDGASASIDASITNNIDGASASITNNNDGWNSPVFDDQIHLPACDYPPLRCSSRRDIDTNVEFVDSDKCVETKHFSHRRNTAARDHLEQIEQRIYRMERTSSSGCLNCLEKGGLRENFKHNRQFSLDGAASSLLGREDHGYNAKKFDEWPSLVEEDLDSRDDISDRVYTIDTVYGIPQFAPTVGVCNDCTSTQTGDDSMFRGNFDIEESDIKKLYMRLQALEADRESLKQEIISIRTDKAQLVLLKEIAQNLCKGVSQSTIMVEKSRVRRSTMPSRFSIMSTFKWIGSFILWRRNWSKYDCGLSKNTAGLHCVLEKSSLCTQLRRRSARPQGYSGFTCRY